MKENKEDTPQTPEEEVDYSVKGFIHKYMNDHNMRTRWLRGIFYDEEEKIDTILLYMRKIEEKISQAEERGRRRVIEAIKNLIK